ncbi:hypothetical protein P4S72_07215 [Vibrio sp. PP-XX7]
MQTTEALRTEIAALVEQYAKLQYQEKLFVAGETIVPPSGKVIGCNRIAVHGGSVFRWLAYYWAF